MRQKIQQADADPLKPLHKELLYECDQIRNAVQRFNSYMRNNAIMPFNNDTLAYINSRIQEEKIMVSAGQSEYCLERLEKYRAQYEQYLESLHGATSQDQLYQEADIQIDPKEIDDLCRLKHFGDDMRRILKENTETATVYQEEIPVDLGPDNQWERWHIT
jgi:hypothetical protein